MAEATPWILDFEDRRSDSPLIERVWGCHSARAGTFQSVASSHCELVVSRVRGKTWLTLRGPETGVTPADCPADAEWVGIRLSLGSYFPHYPASALMDRRDVNLPDNSARSFWMLGSTWEYPTMENAEVLVSRLVRAGLLTRDPAVSAFLQGDQAPLSRRTTQRHFRMATGMSYRTHQQISRARYAVQLLRDRATIRETVHLAGYFDQAHLTRSLRRHIGETPARLASGREEPMSFLYKTDPPGWL